MNRLLARSRGVSAPSAGPADDVEVAERLAARVAAGDSLRDASAAVARELAGPRRRAYALALSLRDGAGTRRD
jgi:hypothetical protein